MLVLLITLITLIMLIFCLTLNLHLGIAGAMQNGRHTAIMEIESLHVFIPVEMQLTDLDGYLHLRDEGKTADFTNLAHTGSSTAVFHMLLLVLSGATHLNVAVAITARYIVLRSVFLAHNKILLVSF